jgi:secretion/DNA translocation related TadE-like protein
MAGAALSVAVLVVTASLSVASAAAGAATVRATRLGLAADAAALAAADAASGAVTGVPCDRAAEIARRGGAQIVECGVDGLVATVVASIAIGPFPVRAAARAGPPP